MNKQTEFSKIFEHIKFVFCTCDETLVFYDIWLFRLRPFRAVIDLFLFKPSEKQFAKYLSNPHISEGCNMRKKPCQLATDTKVCTQVKLGSAK